ncbi:MAG TPA: hypothetical protein VF179_10535, partial [Thermoanaerobaculia bacterium]|nr:hypothetical protein [Thermoanaerobaculia bacterium]
PAPVRRNLVAAPWFRAVVALSLLIVGLALPWLSGVLRSLAGVTGSLWSLADVVRLGMEGLVAVSQGLVAALALWDWLLEIGRTLQAPFATPQAALMMGGCLLVSVAAFYFLRDLISRNRSWSHVESI